MSNVICHETGLRKYESKFDAQNAGVKKIGKTKMGKDRSFRPIKYSTYECRKCGYWHMIVSIPKAAVREEVEEQVPTSPAKRALKGFAVLFKNLREGRVQNHNM